MFLKTNLGGVMKEALDFASSTGLAEVQGILPDLPGAAAWGWSESATAKTASQHDNTKRVKWRWPRLDAGALVDPAPFLGMVFVGVVLQTHRRPCSASGNTL